MNSFCKNCPPDCLNPQPLDCIVYTGDSIPGLGIETGDSLKKVMDALIAKVQTSSGMSADSIDANIADMFKSSVSPCYEGITELVFEYLLESDQGKVIFFYDLNKVLDALPSDYFVASVSVRSYGNGQNLIYNGSAKSSSFVFSFSHIPVSVQFEIKLLTPCGTIVLSKLLVFNENLQFKKYKGTLDAKDYSLVREYPTLNQKEYNELIGQEIQYLRQKLDSIVSEEIVLAVEVLRNKVKSLEEKL